MNIKTFKKHKKTYLKKMEKKENVEEESSNSKPELIIIQNKKCHFKSKENKASILQRQSSKNKRTA